MSERRETVLLDLNNPVFQRQLFTLPKAAQLSVLSTLRKVVEMTWQQVHRDRGLRWEAIYSRTGPHAGRLYSFRLTQGFRGVAYRDGSWLRILFLHPA